MYLSVHSPVSLIVTKFSFNPIISFLLAFILHFVIDTIPHESISLHLWARKNKAQRYFILALIDFFILFILLYFLYSFQKFNLNLNTFAALLGGILPDILWGLNVLSKNKIKFLNNYSKLHLNLHTLFYKNIYLSDFLSFLIQILTFILFILLYLKI